MNKLYIDSFVEKKLTAGVQLLDEKDFSNIKEKNQLVQLVTKS
ncbi:TPA: class I SAM-dependent rRNA methyltransferase, partial [Streptococcus pyogenes]